LAVKRERNDSQIATTATQASQATSSPRSSRRTTTNAATTSINAGVSAADSLLSSASASHTGSEASRRGRNRWVALSRAPTQAASSSMVNSVSIALFAAAAQCTGSRCMVSAPYAAAASAAMRPAFAQRHARARRKANSATPTVANACSTRLTTCAACALPPSTASIQRQ